MKDLKLLVKDYAPIAKNALTILINISADLEVLKDISKDDAFLELLLSRITVCQFLGANIIKDLRADVGNRIRRNPMRTRSRCSLPTWQKTMRCKECWS